jgi:hypothetical protein
MTAATQFATEPGFPATDDRPIFPRRDALVLQSDEITTAPGSARIHSALPIFMLGLGVALTVMWTVFLGWVAITVITLVT